MAHAHEPDSSAANRGERLLDFGDRAIYIVVAVLFLLAALGMAIYAVVTLVSHAGEGFPAQLTEFINDLLLVLIILEVLSTVRSYLSTGHTSVQPFLFIGIISATRRILAIGVETSLGPSTDSAFRRQTVELAVNAGVVLALALAIFLLSRRSGAEPVPSSGQPSD
jgi:uncharacterized membrane protein (DUF373 family)